MSVYFATCREANAVKIGHSLDPYARMSDLQIGCPLPMKLEAILPGGFEQEQEYHQRFAVHRIHGEWFRINEIIELMIQQNPAPPPPPKKDAAEARRERAEKRREERDFIRRRDGRLPPARWDFEERAHNRTMRRKYESAMAEMRATRGDA